MYYEEKRDCLLSCKINQDMINWVVGEGPESSLVCRFPPDNGVHTLEKISQPAEIQHRKESNQVELEVGADVAKFRFAKAGQSAAPEKRITETESWEIRDKNGRIAFTGAKAPMSENSWFVVKEVVNRKGEKEYHVTPVDDWLQFQAKTSAMEKALDLEQSEQMMKESKLKAKQEFSNYLREKRKKAVENGLIEPVKEDDESTIDKKKKKLIFRRLRGNEDADDMDLAESSLAYVGKAREFDGEWEGEEAFSDDDETLFRDETNENVELGIDVEDDDVEKDKEVVDDEDLDAQAVELFKSTFGSEIEKLMHQEQEKEHVADDELDNELSQYAGLEEREEGAEVELSKSAPSSQTAAATVRKTVSKEEQIRARVKGMFWRNDNKLKLREILSQFPGLSKTSEDYQFLTKALRDLAEVQGDVLNLKQQFRK